MPGIGNVEVSIVTVPKMYVCQEYVLLTKYMPGIGYLEPYQVASTVIMNKIYARNRFC